MAAVLIGRARCPLCSSDRARLTLAKSELPVLTCNGCNLQVFARSTNSDARMRALVIEPAASPAAPEPQPAPATVPTPPPPAGMAWGVLRHG